MRSNLWTITTIYILRKIKRQARIAPNDPDRGSILITVRGKTGIMFGIGSSIELRDNGSKIPERKIKETIIPIRPVSRPETAVILAAVFFWWLESQTAPANANKGTSPPMTVNIVNIVSNESKSPSKFLQNTIIEIIQSSRISSVDMGNFLTTDLSSGSSGIFFTVMIREVVSSFWG